MFYEKYISVLTIDLDTGKIDTARREDLYEYLGGVGVASKLLEENLKSELPPLDPQQPIVFAIGGMTTVYPVVTKTVAMFRSPLSGELGESYAGGRLAMTMMMAGYDAIVIKGKAAEHSYLSISRNDVQVKDARAIWGAPTEEVGRVIRERERGSGKRSILRIGVAGENLVKYASVSVDTYRHFGRLGLGAVFGSKNLKAMAVIGDREIPVQNYKEYFGVFSGIYKKVTTTDIMSKYHDEGTPINVEPLNAGGGLPTMNLQAATFAAAEELSGEAFATKNLVRKVACTGCPVGCIHIGQFRREFDQGHEYEAISVGYDYELIFALGSFLGVKTTDEVLQLIDVVEQCGVDAMSVGVVLGWATEALQKGLINQEQTIVPLAFGDMENYSIAIRNIASRTNEFYRTLGEGVAKAAKAYGGKDFAMNYAGNEMSGYHTGYGIILGSTVGARHSHLCNGGYSYDQTIGITEPLDEEKLVDKIFAEEKERCMLNSLTICLFARKLYDRPTIISALHALGREMTDEDLTALGEKIYKTKLRIKEHLGFRQTEVKLPKRFFETKSFSGQLDEATAYRLIGKYNDKIKALMGEESK
jgi:aldehyde:ferredoxin oxidoreductase